MWFLGILYLKIERERRGLIFFRSRRNRKEEGNVGDRNIVKIKGRGFEMMVVYL